MNRFLLQNVRNIVSLPIYFEVGILYMEAAEHFVGYLSENFVQLPDDKASVGLFAVGEERVSLTHGRHNYNNSYPRRRIILPFHEFIIVIIPIRFPNKKIPVALSLNNYSKG